MFRRFTKENLTKSSENNNYLICIRFYLVQVLCLWKQCELYICIDDTDQHRFEELNQRVNHDHKTSTKATVLFTAAT